SAAAGSILAAVNSSRVARSTGRNHGYSARRSCCHGGHTSVCGARGRRWAKFRPMSPATNEWILAIQLFGIVLWTGGMLACLRLLATHGAVGKSAPEQLSLTARRTAVLMDIGATIALLTGLHLLFGPTKPLTQGGWMHAKLTLVVLGMFG